MKRNIRSARINIESSKLLKELNDSLPFDKELYREDIIGYWAHSKMYISKESLVKMIL